MQKIFTLILRAHAIFGCCLYAGPSIALDTLKINQPIVFEAGADRLSEFSVCMSKGTYASVEVVQLGIDVKATLFRPDGTQLDVFDSPNDDAGEELVVIAADTTGCYKIEVAPFQTKKRNRGQCMISLIALDSNRNHYLDQVLTHLHGRGHVPGFRVSIANQSGTQYEYVAGYANVKEHIPFTGETYFSLESISKTFIGISLLMLKEEGKIDLDDDINQYLPFKVQNPHRPNSKISLRHLATHSAAINDGGEYNKACWITQEQSIDYRAFPKQVRKELKSLDGNRPGTLEAFMQSFFVPGGEAYSKSNFFKRPAGEEWYYSNVGSSLAALIIENISGMPYYEFVSQRIWKPLGLEDFRWHWDLDSARQRSERYALNDIVFPDVQCATYPDGGVMANGDVLSAYLRLWITAGEGRQKILSESSWSEIMKGHFVQDSGRFQGIVNGLFWWHFSDGRMGHNGGSYGLNANMFFYPASKTGYTTVENISINESIDVMMQSRHLRQILQHIVPHYAALNVDDTGI